MAKKFKAKNVKINKEEFSVTKVGELDNNQKSPIFVLVFLGIMLSVIFFLPDMEEIKKQFIEKKDYIFNNIVKEVKEKKDDETPVKENKLLSFSSDLTVSIAEGVSIDTFKLEKNTLSFKVTNASSNRYSFATENYFLELYTENDTLLERIILSDLVVLKQTSEVFALDITSTAFKKLQFVKKEVSDYPNVILEKNENDEEFLVCKNKEEVLTYKFLKGKLVSVSSEVNYKSDAKDYANLLETWKKEAETLNAREGIQSIFVNTGVNFIVNTEIDLNTAKMDAKDRAVFYKKDELPKVIKFEMEARGFTCK